ncbi:MAG: hypothetical protein QXS93_04045 [Candidatus Micrarchaeia archaeon]
MSDEIEFIDVALLEKIDAETTVEGFGSKISSTFFEAANLLGTLKIKGLIEIHSAIGNSPVLLTEKGKLLLKDFEANAEAEIGKIDLAVLGSVRGGLRDPKKVEAALNINGKDIAYSIYRLAKKGYLEYKVRNGSVELVLTTRGFEEENPTVKEHANRVIAKTELARPVVKAPGEVRNKTAEELAAEEFVVESGDARKESMALSKMMYYIDRYKWYGVLALIAAAAVLLLVFWK